MPEQLLKPLARFSANCLPTYRAYRGYRTAERLRTDMCNPADRDWSFAGRVLLDASTDKVDGWLSSYAGATRFGGYLDQLGDKIWFLLIAQQLAVNGEISPLDHQIASIRDAALTTVRPIAQHFGLETDARVSGKVKMLVQSGATIAACSPLANDYPEVVQGLYHLATGLSVASGLEVLVDYKSEFQQRYQSDKVGLFVTGVLGQLAVAA